MEQRVGKGNKTKGTELNKNLLSPGAETAAGRLAVLVFLGLVVYFSVYVLTGDIAKLLSYVPDDTAYFLEIAENAAGGNGLSFDGLNPTNGYQPLWQFALVPFYALVKTTPETALRLVLLLQVVLLTVASYWFYGALGRIFPPSALLVSVLFFVFYVFVQAVSGMETALLVFVLALLFRLAMTGPVFRSGDLKSQFVFGMVLGLVMLARLDMVFLAAAVETFCLGQFFLRRDRRSEAAGRMAAIFLGATLVVAPYLVFNLVNFGSMAPISAKLKHGFPHLAPDLDPMKIPRRDLAFGLLAGGYLLWSAIRMRRWIRDPDPRSDFAMALAVLALGSCLHLLDVVLYVKWAIFSWHFISYRLFGALLVCLVAAGILGKAERLPRQPLYWLGIVILAGLVGQRIYLKHNVPANNWSNAAYEAAVWARENTPADAVFAMKDAGNFGYFSRRRTINLDGLVNNLAFQEALKEKRLANHLTDQNLDYLIQHAFNDRDDITAGTYESVGLRYDSHLFEVASDEIVLHRADEAFRSKPYPRFGSETLLVIWKWRR